MGSGLLVLVGITRKQSQIEIMRRKNHLFIAFVFILLINGCAESPDGQLIGEWKSIDSSGVTLFFNDDKTFLILEEGIVKGGESEGDTASWKLDADHDPMHLDIIITNKQGKTGITPSIIRFLGKNKIQIHFADDGGMRPVKFTESRSYQQILYERQ